MIEDDNNEEGSAPVENVEEQQESSTDQALNDTPNQTAESDEKLGPNQLNDFSNDTNNDAEQAKSLEAVYDVPVQISAVLGSTEMPIQQLLKLGRGAVVELDRRVGEAIDIFVNNRLIARGEVVVMDDRLGITMTEIIKV